MGVLLLGFVWVLNFAISFWNAYSVGKVWVETKVAGGWLRFMAWMGAVMAACGFSWCYLLVLALGAHYLPPTFGMDPWIGKRGLEVCMQTGYIIIIPFILFAGWAITIDSLVQAWRQRDLPSMGVAAWNLFASSYNTYNAINDYGPALKSATSYFGGFSAADDEDEKVTVIMIVAAAILGGVITTMAIIYKFSAQTPPPDYIYGEHDQYKHEET